MQPSPRQYERQLLVIGELQCEPGLVAEATGLRDRVGIDGHACDHPPIWCIKFVPVYGEEIATRLTYHNVLYDTSSYFRPKTREVIVQSDDTQSI